MYIQKLLTKPVTYLKSSHLSRSNLLLFVKQAQKNFLCFDREWKTEKEVLNFPTCRFYFRPKSQDLPQGWLEGIGNTHQQEMIKEQHHEFTWSYMHWFCAVILGNHINISFFSESQHSFHPMDFLNISSQRC